MAENLNFTDRVLPHSKEAEQSVLGSMLSSPQAVGAACEILKPDDFFFGQNKEVYAAILELFNENAPIDMVTVSDRLNQRDKLDSIGGVTYLSTLVLAVPTTGNVEYYAKIVKDKATLRRLIYSTQGILSILG